MSPRNPDHFMETSGSTDPVWVHKDKYENRPRFPPLQDDIQTEVCVVGSGIAGVSVAYELVARGKDVVLIEARDTLSGETGRTSGHLSNALDDHYVEIAKKHGREGARAAAERGIFVHPDVHVGKAQWCCSHTDGNAWFDDVAFNTTRWRRGLAYVAAWARQHPNVASIRSWAT
ncbi:hypothetical protein VTK73DRAFT_6995 [Phialemonium thermophilum]|uniref:FAD dependent oxidoreductase domain-containing protein n=1 Tax=Phialemonium thermophilum TaxID=223376 RepID=A0ABR3WHA0_9PEZI